MQGLGYLPRGAQPGTTQLLHIGHLIGDQTFGPLHEAGKDTHAVQKPPAIGGMMDGGLHAGGI